MRLWDLEQLRCGCVPGCVPGSEPYHELGVAVLEGAARVPVALLLAVHHTALHSVLDLGGDGRSARTLPHEACTAPEGQAEGPRGGVCVGCPPRTRQAQGPPPVSVLSVPFVG